ncbi:MAG: DPP IV N-terminal domain-containing protein [Lysobacterales bacterium]
MRSFLLLLLALGALPVIAAETLTIDRLFEDPALSGPSPRMLKLSPDGKRVTFLRGKSEDQTVFDLWEYHVPSKQTRLLVDSASLTGGGAEQLSDAEKARRERMRIAGTSGIVEYQWSADGKQLLFPIAGSLYVYRIDAKQDAVKTLTQAADGFATDPKFSPKGRYVSFVRDATLYAIEIDSGTETRVSPAGSGTVSYGMAEFVAQEEMGRYSGYWWAPDDSAIAYARVDDAPVAVEKRFEIYADRTEVIEQRYPAAGKANAEVRLFVRPLASEEAVEIDLGDNRDIYLARVNWLPDSQSLLLQRQSRDQRTLDLMRAEAATGASAVIHTEVSKTWVNLHDNLKVLDDGKSFVWSSELSGYQHLELRAIDGSLIRPLSSGPWVVEDLLAVDQKQRRVYFSGNADDPREKHVYFNSLDTTTPGSPTRVTLYNGWHEAVFSSDGKVFVDTYSNENTPPQVRLHEAGGKELAVLEANKVEDGHPYHPYLKSHLAPEFGSLKAEDGQTLYYRMIKPTGFDENQRYPVLIRVYGGPHVQYVQRSWDSRWGLFDQVMAQRGYIVFTLDNRGSARRGVKFESPIFRRMGGPEVADQMVGVRWLAEQPFVDAAHIGYFGWSYGGYMTLMMLAKHSGPIAAGVAVAPVTDWRLYDTHYTERYMDDPGRFKAAYDASSLFPHLAGLKSPLYLIHGMADDNVLFTHSTQLMAELQQRGTQFDLMTYPGGKHGINQSAAVRKHVFNSIAGWLDRELRVKGK